MAMRALVLAVALCVTAHAHAQQPPIETEGLGQRPFGRMHMLFEKTIFNVDVLTVEIRFDAETADALKALAAGQRESRELTDRLALRAARAEEAYLEIRFKRNVSLDDFLDAVKKNLERARKANLVDDATFQTVSRGLPRWFAFLEEDGIKNGDRILYRSHRDSLRTVYVDKNGRVRLDQTDAGPTGRLALFGGYFAPGSDFKDGLIGSLFHE